MKHPVVLGRVDNFLNSVQRDGQPAGPNAAIANLKVNNNGVRVWKLLDPTADNYLLWSGDEIGSCCCKIERYTIENIERTGNEKRKEEDEWLREVWRNKFT